MWFRWYFRTLCIEYRIVPVEYFLDNMRLSELLTITDTLEYVDRSSWEQTRISCLISAQKVSKKKLKLKDIFALPWDNDVLPEQTEEDIKAALEAQKSLENLLNGKQQ